MTAALVDLKALEQLVAVEVAAGQGLDPSELSDWMDDLRRTRGVDPDAVDEAAEVMTLEYLKSLMVGMPLEVVLVSAFKLGFDLGMVAAIEAETRRIAAS